jgi:hypothetical protein
MNADDDEKLIVRPLPNPNDPVAQNIPLKLDMTNEPGFVKMTFDPPIMRMRLRPSEARQLAIGLLNHAESAEHAKNE